MPIFIARSFPPKIFAPCVVVKLQEIDSLGGEHLIHSAHCISNLAHCRTRGKVWLGCVAFDDRDSEENANTLEGGSKLTK